MSYTKSYIIKTDDENKRTIVKLIDWNGSVAEVMVNSKSAGIIAWPPYELDISDKIKEGENEISVVVSGTLKNLLGPHHFGSVRGSVRPASFANAPKHIPSGNEYDFIDYGLFQDFMLIRSDGRQKVYRRTKQVTKPIFNTLDSISVAKPISVSVSTETEGAEIRYTLDGSEPNRSSQLYSQALLLKKSAVVTVRSFKNEFISSPIAQRKFYIVKKKIMDSGSSTYKKGIEYSYYEGIWSKVPDFAFLSAISKGRIADFDIDGFERRFANFAVEFKGYIKIDEAGIYNFYVNSNDGSILYINDILIVDNDGVHGNTERTGRIKLTKGLHPIKLQYFDGGGSQSLNVQYKGPGIERQTIPVDKLMHRE